MWGIFLRGIKENSYRVKIAIQLSFIIWVMLGIFIFYATFGAAARMLGTLTLLLMVIIFTPFLSDGTAYEDKGSRSSCEDD